MRTAKKKQLRSWLKTGSIGCLTPRLTTPYPTHSLINLTIDIGRSWNRRRPLPIPTLLRVEGGDFRDTLTTPVSIPLEILIISERMESKRETLYTSVED